MTSCPHPPTHVPTAGPITQTNEYLEYLNQHNITGLFNGMMAGLMIALPEDHIDYLRRAVDSAGDMGVENVRWQTFVWKLHPHRNLLRQKLIHPPIKVDGGNLPVGVIEKRDFMLSLVDEATIRRPRLPFWHVDYFTQPQLDDPEFFLTPDWLVCPRAVMPDSAAIAVRPERLCPSPPPKEVDESDALVSGSSVPDSEPRSRLLSDEHLEETTRRLRLPFGHIDYFTQPELDDPEFFPTPVWQLPIAPTESCSTALSPSGLSDIPK